MKLMEGDDFEWITLLKNINKMNAHGSATPTWVKNNNMRSTFKEKDEDDMEEGEYEYKALHNENMESKKTIQEMSIKEDLVAEDYEIEKMSVQTLKECLKSLKEHHMKMTCEADTCIQNLKQEKHKLHGAAHQSRKDVEVDKLEIKQLKCNNETMRSEIIKLISSHQLKLDKLQEDIDLQRKKLTVKIMKLRI